MASSELTCAYESFVEVDEKTELLLDYKKSLLEIFRVIRGLY